MNYLMLSVGRRAELLKDFKKSLPSEAKLIATDCSPYAPALYFADKQYIVPSITDESYIRCILDICKKENVKVVTTFIDPEIEILSNNRELFKNVGVEVLAPYEETAKLCFDKFLMFKFCKNHGIPTVQTYGSIAEFDKARENKEINFPVFVKPRNGSGSVGARKITDYATLKKAVKEDPSLIIQELMVGIDLDADVYIDTITHEAITAFSKRKIETRIGGASKTISFKDPELFALIRRVCEVLKFNGPVDMDFFYKDGRYYLSEVNPRFGGAYLHAYGAGVDFIKLIEKNLHGEANVPEFGNYDDGVVMMMYDSVVIKKENELAK